MPYLNSFLFWNVTASTSFITECPTQLLSCGQSFKNNLVEDIQNGVFLLPCLFGTAYSNCFQWIWYFQSLPWSHATCNWNCILSYYYYYLLLNLGLFVGGLVLSILLRFHLTPISNKSVWRFLLKYSRVGVGI